MARRNQETMFETLKARFPHIDLGIVNPELTFSENLQIIVSQLGSPQPFSIGTEINHMKNAVDRQQLKIQKSLVNEQDVLGNIMNRAENRVCKEDKKHSNATMEVEEDSLNAEHQAFWHNDENLRISGHTDMLSEIWELGSQFQQGWFHHEN